MSDDSGRDEPISRKRSEMTNSRKNRQVPPVGLDEPIDPMTFREAHVTRDILRGNWIHLNLRVWVRRWKKKFVETKKIGNLNEIQLQLICIGRDVKYSMNVYLRSLRISTPRNFLQLSLPAPPFLFFFFKKFSNE